MELAAGVIGLIAAVTTSILETSVVDMPTPILAARLSRPQSLARQGTVLYMVLGCGLIGALYSSPFCRPVRPSGDPLQSPAEKRTWGSAPWYKDCDFPPPKQPALCLVRLISGKGPVGVRSRRLSARMPLMQITAQADYAIRALVELAVAGGGPMKSEPISKTQEIPRRFLENTLRELRNAGLVGSQRGPDGGYRLTRPPSEITLADIIRAVDGPLVTVRSEAPENLNLKGSAQPLREVWFALRGNMRAVLEAVSLADIAEGRLPDPFLELAAQNAARHENR